MEISILRIHIISNVADFFFALSMQTIKISPFEYNQLKIYWVMLTNKLPTFKGPIEAQYFKERAADIIEDLNAIEYTKKVITSLINEEIDKQCITLIGYTNINILNKPLRLTQFNEALTNYLIRTNNDKTLLCKIINANTLRPMMLLPSKIPLPTNITYETYAGAFGDINDVIELSLTYDYNINEYFFIKAIKSYNEE